jgi:hypothetical protein
VIISPTHRLPSSPRNTPSTHFCYSLCQPQGHVAVGRITSMKNSSDPIGNQTHNLMACSPVPQPMALCASRWNDEQSIIKENKPMENLALVWTTENNFNYMFTKSKLNGTQACNTGLCICHVCTIVSNCMAPVNSFFLKLTWPWRSAVRLKTC